MDPVVIIACFFFGFLWLVPCVVVALRHTWAVRVIQVGLALAAAFVIVILTRGDDLTVVIWSLMALLFFAVWCLGVAFGIGVAAWRTRIRKLRAAEQGQQRAPQGSVGDQM